MGLCLYTGDLEIVVDLDFMSCIQMEFLITEGRADNVWILSVIFFWHV
jgi:hypothetical protein